MSVGGARLFLALPSVRTRSCGLKLKYKKFHLNMGKNFFMLRVAEHLDRLSRWLMETPSLETFKAYLDASLCHLLSVTLP